MGVLFSDEIPDARDIVIISLADMCGLFRGLFAVQELERVAPRIEQVRKIELMGREVSKAVRHIDSSLAAREAASLLLANFDAVPFDYVARQKIQGQHLNWFIVEQLPVVPPETYETVRFRLRTAGEIVREAVLELTYTAHDMAPFAHDIGHVDAAGDLLPRFVWDEERRLCLRAKLDAVFFHL